MRIAFLTPEYPTESHFAGGLASYLHRVTKALTEGGHQAEVFTLSHVRERIADGPVLVHRVKRRTSLQKTLSKVPFFGRDAGYADVVVPGWNLAAALYRRHREAPFDVAQASNFQACGLVAALRNAIPLVTRISSYEPLWRAMYRKRLTRQQWRLERAEIVQVRWSAATYAPSAFLAETLKAEEGLNVRVIEPPFDLEPHAQTSPVCGDLAPEGYALFFGAIGYLKGCDRLVDVLPGLLDRNQDLRFVFAGPISTVSFHQHVHRKLAPYIGTRVFILEPQKHPAVLSLIQRSRFVVLPSKIDNLPNACMEAMALERVVIGTLGASFEQLIADGVNGFLVSQEDDRELASCMERVWGMDPEERSRIGGRAARSLERLRPENAIRPLIELFEEVTRQAQQGNQHGVLRRLTTRRRPHAMSSTDA